MFGKRLVHLARRHFSVSQETVLQEIRGSVAVLTLNRPKQLNALNIQLMKDMTEKMQELDKNPDVGAIVVTGSGGKAFAAGADIAEMAPMTMQQCYKEKMFQQWDLIRGIQKPIIAAVNGFALGGGCELAMMCDIVLAGEKAKFGQPEIKLGTIPGIGGTQRLTRAVGKSRAMELVLTGDFFSAEEAVKMGLASRVVSQDTLLDEAVALGQKISDFSPFAVARAKEAVNKSYEVSLTEGLMSERQMFYTTFGTDDRKEGMAAFLEKRNPDWKNN